MNVKKMYYILTTEDIKEKIKEVWENGQIF